MDLLAMPIDEFLGVFFMTLGTLSNMILLKIQQYYLITFYNFLYKIISKLLIEHMKTPPEQNYWATNYISSK